MLVETSGWTALHEAAALGNEQMRNASGEYHLAVPFLGSTIALVGLSA
jgi:hypothetical protein